MQLNSTTDYSIRIMLYLALRQAIVNTTEISEAMIVPLNNCRKIMQYLKKAKLIQPHPGVDGGYTLNKPATEITLGEILWAIGEKPVLNRCLDQDHFCNRNAVETCLVRKVYEDIQFHIDRGFSTTLQMLVDENNGQGGERKSGSLSNPLLCMTGVKMPSEKI